MAVHELFSSSAGITPTRALQGAGFLLSSEKGFILLLTDIGPGPLSTGADPVNKH